MRTIIYRMINSKALESAQGTLFSIRDKPQWKRIWKRMHTYVWLNHFTVQQKLTQHCKSTILQFLRVFFFFNKKKERHPKALSVHFCHQTSICLSCPQELLIYFLPAEPWGERCDILPSALASTSHPDVASPEQRPEHLWQNAPTSTLEPCSNVDYIWINTSGSLSSSQQMF